MEHLRQRGPGSRSTRALLDQAKAEVDVAEKAPLGGWEEVVGPPSSSRGPTRVVEKPRREQEVGAQALVELCGLAAERGDADRVLEEAAGPRVVALLRGGQDAKAGAKVRTSATSPATNPRRPVWAISAARNSKNPSSSSTSRLGSGTSSGGIGFRSLERAHLELESVAEALHATQHADGVSLPEALVEQLDVVPDTGFDLAGRVDELEGEIGAAGASAEPLGLRATA